MVEMASNAATPATFVPSIAELEAFKTELENERDQQLSYYQATLAPVSDLVTKNYLSILQSQELADFCIKCCGFSFKVHKFVLYSQSAYFQKLINSPFAEGQSDSVELGATEPLAVGMLILYLYGAKSPYRLDQVYKIFPQLKEHAEKSISGSSEKVYMQVHEFVEAFTQIELYALADRLLVDHLPAAVAELIYR